jgi:hypothetical protein
MPRIVSMVRIAATGMATTSRRPMPRLLPGSVPTVCEASIVKPGKSR